MHSHSNVPPDKRTRRSIDLMRDTRGTATVEYLVVLVSFTLAVTLALVALGPSVVEMFQVRILVLALPFP
jgi:Flp pilus assembly pilin Flp